MPTVERIKQVPLKELRTWERNPRIIDKAAFARLKASMEADPEMMQARPCIAVSGVDWTKDGLVVAGNMRLLAAAELGWPKIATAYVTDIDEQTATTWALRDNVAYGDWQDDNLAELLAELHAQEVDLSLTGFNDDYLNELLAQVGVVEPLDRGGDLALADLSIGDPTHVVTKGEVWKVGEHTLVVAEVYEGWSEWVEFLDGDVLFVPYPTPTLTLTSRADRQPLVMVQPDVWLAGHVLDKFSAVRGDKLVSRLR